MSDQTATQHIYFTLPDARRPSSHYRDTVSGRETEAEFLLGALARLGLVGRADAETVQLHLVASETVTQEALAALIDEIRPNLNLGEEGNVDGVWSRRIQLTAPYGTSAQWVLPHMLKTVQPGDGLFVETTQGLRPVQMALTVGASLLSTLQGTAIKQPFYAAQPLGGVWVVEPIADLFGALEQTMAIRDFLHHLRPATLERREPGRLGRLAQIFDSNDTRTLRQEVESLPAQGSSEALSARVTDWAVARLQAGFRAPAQSGTDAAMHQFLDDELALAQRLRAAGRFGDALRLLREHVANIATFAVLRTFPIDDFAIGYRDRFEQIGLRSKPGPARCPAFFFLMTEERNRATHGALQERLPQAKASLKHALEQFDALPDPSQSLFSPACDPLSGAGEVALAALRATGVAGAGERWLSTANVEHLLVLLIELLRVERDLLLQMWSKHRPKADDRGMIVWLEGGGWRAIRVNEPRQDWLSSAGKLRALVGSNGLPIAPDSSERKGNQFKKDLVCDHLTRWCVVIKNGSRLPDNIERFPWELWTANGNEDGLVLTKLRTEAPH